MPTYLTVNEVAQILRRKIGRIYSYLEEGQFPNAKKLRGGWLIPQSDVNALLDGLPSSGNGEPPPAGRSCRSF